MSELKDALQFIKDNSKDAACKLVANKALEELENYDICEDSETEAVSASASEALTNTSIDSLTRVHGTINDLYSEFENLDFSTQSGKDRGQSMLNTAKNIMSKMDDFDYDDMYGDCECLVDDLESELDDWEGDSVPF